MINYTEYQNLDGTFTSPKNNKNYKTLTAFIAHWHNSGTGGQRNLHISLVNCNFCKKQVTNSNIKRHEISCYLNPINYIECVICNNPIKNYKSSKGTCSYSCANKHFKTGTNNGNWTGTVYQSICFLYHKKECIICGENKIVAVHHYDENHNNNDPKNLVPLCPTHHSYMHSRYAIEILSKIEKYVLDFDINKCNTKI